MPIDFRCSQCGKLLRTGDDTAGRQAECPACGALTTVPAPEASAVIDVTATAPFAVDTTATARRGNTDGKATAALVLGLVGLCFWCCPLIGFPITLAGLILGILSLRSASRSLAVAGIILSSIGLVLTVANSVLGVMLKLGHIRLG